MTTGTRGSSLFPYTTLFRSGLWILWERRHERRGFRPMVNLYIFRTASFANGTTIVTLYFLGMTSIWVLVALYVQDGLGMSALQSGMFGVPGALLSAWEIGRASCREAEQISVATKC